MGWYPCLQTTAIGGLDDAVARLVGLGAVRSSSFGAMKKRFFIFIGACLWALGLSPVLAQTGGPDVVVVRFYHMSTTRLHVAIVRGAAKPEEQEMKGSDVEEAQFCQQVIAKLYQEGYTLKAAFATGVVPNTLLFVKGQ